MSRYTITDGYRDGTYLAQCDTCGATRYANELVEQVLQTPGGGPSGLRVCKHHVNPYHPQNNAATYTGEDPLMGAHPRPRKTRTSWTGADDVDHDDSLSQSIPTTSSISPSSQDLATFQATPTLVVTGTNFSSSWPTSKVRIDGVVIATTYDSATQLTATVPVGLVPTATTYTIDVIQVGPPYYETTSSLSADSDSRNTVNQSNDQTLTLS